MVNVLKKLSDVAFQNPAGFGVILADFTGEGAKTIDGFMRTLVFSAGKGIDDKGSVKKWIEFSVNRVVQEAVAYARFVDRFQN